MSEWLSSLGTREVLGFKPLNYCAEMHISWAVRLLGAEREGFGLRVWVVGFRDTLNPKP